MAICIAMDAGGTKAETLVHDETGHILLRDVTPGCTAMDMGTEESKRRLISALTRVREAIPGGVPDRVYCGVASVYYYGRSLTGGVDEAFPDWRIRWEDDGWGMITSMLGKADGCCIICGTGTSLFARAGGALHHIGGWGYLIDTWGSGFTLGREALLAAVRAVDGRGPDTALRALLTRALKAAPEDSIPEIYRGGRAFIASLAHTVFEGRRMGDAASEAIFERCSAALAEMSVAAERYYDGEFDVVMSGGVFAAFPEYAQAVARKGSPRARMIRADVPPVLGCAMENALAEGAEDMAAFKARFMRDYQALCLER